MSMTGPFSDCRLSARRDEFVANVIILSVKFKTYFGSAAHVRMTGTVSIAVVCTNIVGGWLVVLVHCIQNVIGNRQCVQYAGNDAVDPQQISARSVSARLVHQSRGDGADASSGITMATMRPQNRTATLPHTERPSDRNPPPNPRRYISPHVKPSDRFDRDDDRASFTMRTTTTTTIAPIWPSQASTSDMDDFLSTAAAAATRGVPGPDTSLRAHVI